MKGRWLRPWAARKCHFFESESSDSACGKWRYLGTNDYGCLMFSGRCRKCRDKVLGQYH